MKNIFKLYIFIMMLSFTISVQSLYSAEVREIPQNDSELLVKVTKNDKMEGYLPWSNNCIDIKVVIKFKGLKIKEKNLKILYKNNKIFRKLIFASNDKTIKILVEFIKKYQFAVFISYQNAGYYFYALIEEFNKWLSESEDNRLKISKILSEYKSKKIKKQLEFKLKMKKRGIMALGLLGAFNAGGNVDVPTSDTRVQLTGGINFLVLFRDMSKVFNFGVNLGFGYFYGYTPGKKIGDEDYFFKAFNFTVLGSFLLNLFNDKSGGILFEIGYSHNKEIESDFGYGEKNAFVCTINFLRFFSGYKYKFGLLAGFLFKGLGGGGGIRLGLMYNFM